MTLTNESFLNQMDNPETLLQLPQAQIEEGAIFLQVLSLPSREGLFKIRHLLNEQAENTCPFYICVVNQNPIRVGQIYLTLSKLKELQRICFMIDGQLFRTSSCNQLIEIKAEQLISTIKLSPRSIYGEI